VLAQDFGLFLRKISIILVKHRNVSCYIREKAETRDDKQYIDTTKIVSLLEWFQGVMNK